MTCTRPGRKADSPHRLSNAWILVAALAAPLLGPFDTNANDPAKAKIGELIGPLKPSIHVPPVRKQPPALTKPIARPPQYDAKTTAWKQTLVYQMESLRLAIEDLISTFGDAYPDGSAFLNRWDEASESIATESPNANRLFQNLRRNALLANPLLDFDQLLVLKRKRGQLGLPTNHQCNTCLNQKGYDNELAILSPARPAGTLTTLFRPSKGFFVGEMDLHFDADRLVFSMPNGRSWEIHEIGIDGSALRQVTRAVPDVDNFDPCYMPDGRIVFSSTASFTGVPCWHGKERACCLYTMAADGSEVRQVCYDQDLDLHPSVLDNGQVIFSRWEYTSLLHAYVRPLMAMNPDGTGQRALYGSNSYYPNCLFYPRGVPGHPSKVVAVVAGYHGRNRMGELAVIDTATGWSGEHGIVHRITHRGEPVVPVTLDRLTDGATHQFLHPYPLSDKYILAAMQPWKRPWGIYLVDVFDNLVPVLTDPKFDFFEPIPVAKRRLPRIVPDRTDPRRDDAVVVLHDIYQGNGLKGVPRGTIKRLRVAAYHYGYPGMAGPDKIGRAGPWEVMRILGTVPVYEDGSAKFRLPANTPVTLQALDEEGKAVQLMRTWYTAMPGETASCVGCHETPRDTPIVRSDIAATRPISDIEPWLGPPRGFDFAREVQPVLDRHCVGCHNGQSSGAGRQISDLRDERLVPNYTGLPLTNLGATRIDSSIPKRFPERFEPCDGMPKPYGRLKTVYTPSYEALIPFIRRPNIEDGVSLLRPGEYHADTSELIQMLCKGHYGVQLDRESWERLVTWIDLNGPCHGSWGDVADIPKRADRRRFELALATGGPTFDPEVVPGPAEMPRGKPIVPAATLPPRSERLRHVVRLAARSALGPSRGSTDLPETMTLTIGKNTSIVLVRIPKGRFLMGDTSGDGDADEWPPSVVNVAHDFWISRTEITNAQLRSLLPNHTSGYFTKRQIDINGPGIELDGPHQPAVRVSWDEAVAFCRSLSRETDRRVTLPTEAQWEYSARAGTRTALSYGDVATDFSSFGNMADRSLACLYAGTAGVAVMQPFPSIMGRDDQAIATSEVASYSPNHFGLYDMHGNAAEWTRSTYRPYPYDAAAEIEKASSVAKRVVRGGSFHDRPVRCRASHRRSYPAWQAVHDVGFRIVLETD